MESQSLLLLLFLTLSFCFLLSPTQAFYLPGSFPHPYGDGDLLSVKVNSLTSIQTEIPFGYYSLPFCKPLHGVHSSRENLGELLLGDRIESSPFQFKSNVNETDVFLCSTGPLSREEADIIKLRIDQAYHINLILDNLPAIRYTEKDGFTLRWIGFPVGLNFNHIYYVFNHLRFKILVHEYDGVDAVKSSKTENNNVTQRVIVGFEVTPCSYRHGGVKGVGKSLEMYQKFPGGINCDPLLLAMMVKEGEPIVFSYEVSFEDSDIDWLSRWNAYMKMEGSQIHWFSILNSLMVVAFLAAVVFVIFLRTIRRDLTQYEEIGNDVQVEISEELFGWKLVASDAFRPPPHADLLCILVGDGVQILGMAFVAVLFAVFGIISPDSHGALLTGMLFSYLIVGVAAGYVSLKLWRTVNNGVDAKNWASFSWRVSCFFPGVAFLVLVSMNSLLWGSRSTGAIPFYLFIILLLLWFFISVPLTLIGGYFGFKSNPIEYPVRINHIPREIPPAKYPSWLVVMGAGTLPFGTLFIELYFIMSSLWLGQVYYVFGFLLAVMILLVIVCAEVALVLTYMHLCVEDWRWWWQSFFSSGSVAIYILIYCINYLVFDLRSLSGPVSAILYLGYSFLMVLAVLLATGSVGFLSSFWFVYFLFSSVKLD